MIFHQIIKFSTQLSQDACTVKLPSKMQIAVQRSWSNCNMCFHKHYVPVSLAEMQNLLRYVLMKGGSFGMRCMIPFIVKFDARSFIPKTILQHRTSKKSSRKFAQEKYQSFGIEFRIQNLIENAPLGGSKIIWYFIRNHSIIPASFWQGSDCPFLSSIAFFNFFLKRFLKVW